MKVAISIWDNYPRSWKSKWDSKYRVISIDNHSWICLLFLNPEIDFSFIWKNTQRRSSPFFLLFSSCIEFFIDPHNFRDWLFVRSISIHFLFERGIEGKGEIEILSLFNNVLIFRKNFLQTNTCITDDVMSRIVHSYV